MCESINKGIDGNIPDDWEEDLTGYDLKMYDLGGCPTEEQLELPFPKIPEKTKESQR